MSIKKCTLKLILLDKKSKRFINLSNFASLPCHTIYSTMTYFLSFRVFNSDGVLTAEQMRTHLFAEMKNNCIDIELNEMLKALDQDNDGKIKVDDFIRLLTQENSIIKEDGGNSRCGDSCVIL